MNLKPIRLKLLLTFLLFLNPITVFGATDWTSATDVKAAYLMDEASGTLADATGNGNTCTASGSPGAYGGTGKYGDAFDFQEVNNAYFNCGSDTSIDNIRVISVLYWTDMDTAGDSDSASHVSKYGAGADGWRASLIPSGGGDDMQFEYQWTGGVGRWREYSVLPAYPQGYIHWAFTYDSGNVNNDALIYLDGVSLGASSESNTPATAPDDDSGNSLFLGINNNVYEMDGRLDEVLIYGAIMDLTDINEAMDCGIDGSQAGAGCQAQRRFIFVKKDYGDDLILYMRPSELGDDTLVPQYF